MPIYALGAQEPIIAADAYLHPDCVVIGSVRIGSEASIWPCAVLRGDDGEITIGSRTSIQDGCVVHTTVEWATVVGDGCVVGHLAHLEGCTVEDGALIGSNAVVLHGAVIGSGALVAASAVVLGGTRVPRAAMAMGVPAVIREDRADPADIAESARGYVERARRFAQDLRRLD